MKRPRVTILNHDISGNSLGRAYILGKMLSEYFDVKIIGPSKKGEIWKPCMNSDIRIVKLPYYRFPALLFKIPGILKEIDGDVIYAVKPKLSSFGFGLLKKAVSKTPVILDIDDWEMGFLIKRGILGKISRLFNLKVTIPDGFFWTWLMQLFIGHADKITTVSTFLQDKFGGEIIPHAKDTDYLNPIKFNGDELKKQLNIAGRKIVMFLGTPRKHKGIEDVMQAIPMIDNPDLLMIIVGGGSDKRYEESLIRMGGDRLFIIDQIPLQDIPEYLSLADIVVIPQRRTNDSAGQIPSKLFDAMSMAKPIISTRVSDIPCILEGCGIIVEPGSPMEVKEAIQWILTNPVQAKEMGLRARDKCIKQYSMLSLKHRLRSIVDEVINSNLRASIHEN